MVAAAVATQTGLNLVRPLTSYQIVELGGDGRMIGLVSAGYAVIPLVAVLWLGRLAERTRRLSGLFAAGAAVLALGSVFLALADGLGVVALASLLLGVAHVVITIAGQAAIARFSPPDGLDRGFGWFTAGYAMGQLIGPLVGGVILGTEATGGARLELIHIGMLVGAGFALLAVPLLLPLMLSRNAGAGGSHTPEPDPAAPDRLAARDDVDPESIGPEDAVDSGPEENRGESDENTPGEGTAEPAASGRASIRDILVRPGVPSHIAASLALLSMHDLLLAFLPLVGESAGVAPVWVGVLLAIRAAATILSRVLLPVLSARLSRRVLVVISLLGAGIALAFVPSLLVHPVPAVALMVVGGFCLGLGQPLTMTLVIMAVPSAWRSQALAVRLMGNRLGQVVIPLVAGAVAAPAGPAGAIWLACALLTGCGVEKLLRLRR